MTPFDNYTLLDGTIHSGFINLPAVFIVSIMSLILIKGTSESAMVNNFIVFLKVGIVLVFIFVGFKYVRAENLTPLIPENTGTVSYTHLDVYKRQA